MGKPILTRAECDTLCLYASDCIEQAQSAQAKVWWKALADKLAALSEHAQGKN